MITAQLVHEFLTNALNNGYPFTGMTNLEIAEDMIQYCENFEMFEPEELIPHIETWWVRV